MDYAFDEKVHTIRKYRRVFRAMDNNKSQAYIQDTFNLSEPHYRELRRFYKDVLMPLSSPAYGPDDSASSLPKVPSRYLL